MHKMKQFLYLWFFALLTRLDATVPPTSVVKVTPNPGMDMRPMPLPNPDNIYLFSQWIYKKQLLNSITVPKRSIHDKLAILYENDVRYDPNRVKKSNIMAGGLSDHDFFSDF